MGAVLNQHAADQAKKLILVGKTITSSQWTPPSSEMRDMFLQKHGIEAYSKWFLGEGKETDPSNKNHWLFPYSSDFEHVSIAGLEAAVKRAAETNYPDIELAAKKLLELATNEQKTAAWRVAGRRVMVE